MAQAENKDLSEEEKSSLKKIALINKRWGLVIIAPESVPRMKTSSARLGQGLGRWFDSKDDNPRNSVGADTVATPGNFVRVLLNKYKLHNLIKRKFYILITTIIKKHINT